MKSGVNALAKTLWDYNLLHHKLVPSDAIIALGSMDVRAAERAAELWHQELAPVVVVAGGYGRLTKKGSKQTEAEQFQQTLIAKSVPSASILLEDKSTNTAENFQLSLKLLRANGISPAKLIAVTKPYMERRAYATFKKNYPEIDIAFTSPQISIENYPSQAISKDLMINVLVGDTQRVMLYPAKGFCIEQEVPKEVEQAMNKLIAMGYDKQLIK